MWQRDTGPVDRRSGISPATAAFAVILHQHIVAIGTTDPDIIMEDAQAMAELLGLGSIPDLEALGFGLSGNSIATLRDAEVLLRIAEEDAHGWLAARMMLASLSRWSSAAEVALG